MILPYAAIPLGCARISCLVISISDEPILEGENDAYELSAVCSVGIAGMGTSGARHARAITAGAGSGRTRSQTAGTRASAPNPNSARSPRRQIGVGAGECTRPHD